MLSNTDYDEEDLSLFLSSLKWEATDTYKIFAVRENVPQEPVMLNKMYIADMLLPDEYKVYIFNSVKRLQYMTYRAYLSKDKELLVKTKLYYQSIFQKSGFKKFIELNEKIKSNN